MGGVKSAAFTHIINPVTFLPVHFEIFLGETERFYSARKALCPGWHAEANRQTMQGRTNAKQSQISSAETKLSLLALTQGRAEMVQR